MICIEIYAIVGFIALLPYFNLDGDEIPFYLYTPIRTLQFLGISLF